MRILQDLPSRMAGTPRRAPLALAVTALLWSTGGIFIKLVDAPAFAIAGIRSGIALLLMLAVNPRPRFTFKPAQIGTAVSYAACMVTYVVANKLTTSANAIFLQYSAPVWVAILSVFLLGERLRPRDLGALALVATGTVLFFAWDLEPGNLWGNLIAIASGVAFACTFVFGRMDKDSQGGESFMLAHGMAFLVCIPFLGSMSFGGTNLFGLLGLGILQLGISSLLFTASIPHVPTLAGVLIVTLEPVMNPVWVFLGKGEAPPPTALIGGSIIILTVTALQVLDFLRPSPHHATEMSTKS